MSNLDLIEQEVNKTIAASLGTPVRVIKETLEGLFVDMESADESKSKKAKIALKTCILASTNIRDGAVTAGSDKIVTSYTGFSITGTRTQRDTMNFSAIRLAGHMLNAVSTSSLSTKLNAKAGNIMLGTGFSESKAGKINQETFMSLTTDDKAAFAEFKSTTETKLLAVLNTLYTSTGA